jgi:hypothetical protein
MPRVIYAVFHLEALYAEGHILALYTECSNAVCRYAECRFAECRGAKINRKSLFELKDRSNTEGHACIASFTWMWFAALPQQGNLAEGEGSVPLTSSLYSR